MSFIQLNTPEVRRQLHDLRTQRTGTSVKTQVAPPEALYKVKLDARHLDSELPGSSFPTKGSWSGEAVGAKIVTKSGCFLKLKLLAMNHSFFIKPAFPRHS